MEFLGTVGAGMLSLLTGTHAQCYSSGGDLSSSGDID